MRKNLTDFILLDSLYSKHLNRWLNYFPINQFHIVNGENFIKNPHVELKLVERFLGLKPIITKQHFEFDPVKGFFCIKNNRKNLKNLRCLQDEKGRRHPFIEQRVLNKLNQYFKPYSKEFFEIMKKEPFWPI